ncbi:MFS transporter [Pseudonocardia sp.]|uniref:MFS transporter n=1 Tax=Pseudonocardia sp. TaxID=60912 RepID=UPI003D0BE32F
MSRTHVTDAFDRRLIAPMMLGATLNPVNTSMIAVSLVPIGLAFGASPSETAWLVSGLYLATAVGQPVVGRLVDVHGPRRLYLAGTALAGLAGILGMLAPSLWVLVIARVLLGFGTCAGYPAAMYLIRSEGRRTGQDSPASLLALLAIASQIVAVVGPTIAGVLVGLGGWRAVFAVNVPLAVACLVLGALRLPRHPAPDADAPRPRTDLLGIALFAVTLTTLLLFLMSPSTGHWYLVLVAVAAAAVFAVRELRATSPFVDLRVLGGNPALVATYVRALLTFTIGYAFIYGYTQWLQETRGLTPTQAGLLMLPMFVTTIAVTALTGRNGAVRAKLVVAALAQVVQVALFLALGADSGIWLLVLIAVAGGVAMGLGGLGNQNAVYHQSDAERTASSAGLLRTFSYLGAIVAAAATGEFFADGADTPGLHRLAVFLLVVGGICLVVTLPDRSLARVGAGVSDRPRRR